MEQLECWDAEVVNESCASIAKTAMKQFELE